MKDFGIDSVQVLRVGKKRSTQFETLKIRREAVVNACPMLYLKNNGLVYFMDIPHLA